MRITSRIQIRDLLGLVTILSGGFIVVHAFQITPSHGMLVRVVSLTVMFAALSAISIKWPLECGSKMQIRKMALVYIGSVLLVTLGRPAWDMLLAFLHGYAFDDDLVSILISKWFFYFVTAFYILLITRKILKAKRPFRENRSSCEHIEK